MCPLNNVGVFSLLIVGPAEAALGVFSILFFPSNFERLIDASHGWLSEAGHVQVEDEDVLFQTPPPPPASAPLPPAAAVSPTPPQRSFRFRRAVVVTPVPRRNKVLIFSRVCRFLFAV